MKTPLALALALALAAPAGAQTLGWSMTRAIDGLDADGDGLLSLEEGAVALIAEAYDTDATGDYSLGELTAGYFGEADANDDGYLEDEELQALEGLPALGVYELGL